MNHFEIVWRTASGITGRGPSQLSRTEAERLCRALNREFPDISHAVVNYPWDAAQAGMKAIRDCNQFHDNDC